MAHWDIKAPPEYWFARKLAHFICSLDTARNDEILWWVVRYEDIGGNERDKFPLKKEAFEKLRRRLVPLVAPNKIDEMDALLALPDWEMERYCLAEFTSGYWGCNRPLGSDFWRSFRLRGFDSMPDYRREHFIAEFRFKGIDVLNG